MDIQHYLTHAIDHFTPTELVHFQYLLMSASIRNGGRCQNIAKFNALYPDPEVVTAYAEYNDKDMLEKMYTEQLFPKDKSEEYTKDTMTQLMYKTFILPLTNNVDIVILCDRTENVYVDVICKILKKDFHIDVIDLNQLFSEGRVGSIYIDRKKIWDKSVDIRRSIGTSGIRELKQTADGRAYLLSQMDKPAKLKLIKELGFTVKNKTNKELDDIIKEAWVDDESYKD